MSLFAFPGAATVGSRVPRDTLFRRAGGGRAIRALYEAQVDRIDWAFKLFDRSTNLPAAGDVREIQVFRIRLRARELDDRVLEHLDKAVPHPTWFELERATPDGAEVQVAAAFKRRSDADAAARVTHAHWRGAWLPAETPRAPLPPAIALDALYAGMLGALWPHPARPHETLREHAERLSKAAAQAKAVARLEGQVRRERDFARQIDANRALRAARVGLAELTSLHPSPSGEGLGVGAVTLHPASVPADSPHPNPSPQGEGL